MDTAASSEAAPSHCPICRIHSDVDLIERYEIQRDALWVLRHHADPAPLPGWLLLDSVRRVSGPIDFNEEECADWGRAVRGASALEMPAPGCLRGHSALKKAARERLGGHCALQMAARASLRGHSTLKIGPQACVHATAR